VEHHREGYGVKTEKEIKDRLKQTKKTLKETKKRYEMYDDYDDMHAIDELERAVLELDWILA
jgi:guanylate kinase